VRTLLLAPGATDETAPVPFPIRTASALSVDAPVPPFETGVIPEISAVTETAEQVRFPLASIPVAFVPALQSVGFEAKAVAVDALPVTSPVTLPVRVPTKLAAVTVDAPISPDGPRRTRVSAEAVDVPVVAELDTLPAVEIVASFVSTIAAAASTLALTRSVY
jgi:hypothetical protein